MDFGVVTAKVDEIGYITHAENLGYSHCWVTDSPMIRSNCWAVLALAAQQTRRMRLGTGVNVPGLRLAPVVANGIATINRLAPGRCFIGLGTGHTGMRLLGRKPMRLGPFREYVEVVQKLLRGEEADYTLDGETHIIVASERQTSSSRWLMPRTRQSTILFPSSSRLAVTSPSKVTVSPARNGVMARISSRPPS